jgi:hypothetical protein
MIKKREAEKKTAVKQNLVVNGEEDDCVEIPVDSIKEACAEEVVGQKTAMESCVSVSDENYAVENRYDLCEPSVSMAPTSDTRMVNNVGDNVNCNENISEALCDMNYGSDTDEAVSPVLCRNTVGNCSRVESDKYSKREPTQNLTPDMLEKSSSRSGTQKCSSPVKQSKEVEAGDNSDLCNNQNTSLLAEHTQGNRCHCNPFTFGTRLPSMKAHCAVWMELLQHMYMVLQCYFCFYLMRYAQYFLVFSSIRRVSRKSHSKAAAIFLLILSVVYSCLLFSLVHKS